jgi:Uncharacterized protein conserved in bacteria (DUF2255)
VSIATETEGSPHIDRESLKLLVRPVTASNGWRAGELSMIDGSGEVGIATRRSDGATAAWYRGVQTCREGELSAGRLQRGLVFVEVGTRAGEGSGLDDALDAACRGKGGRSSSAVARITADIARAMTLRVDPA